MNFNWLTPLLLLLVMTPAISAAAPLVLRAPANSPQIAFGARHLQAAVAASNDKAPVTLNVVNNAIDKAIKAEGFRLSVDAKKRAITLQACDDKGAMVGLLDLAEQVEMRGSLAKVEGKISNPRLAFRAIKFNLPYMSYRQGESLQLHQETCRDLKFWGEFLDMMALNRFNALTLWSLHPFPYLVRPAGFPEASPFKSDAEFAEWQQFWTSLFRMAKERGIETYLVNWNIFVSPEFARAHNVAQYVEGDRNYIGDGDTSELVKRYTRECVTQVIDEYPDLTGLGITLGERMGGMTPAEREDWIVETFGQGIANAKRPIKFIHRAPLSGDKNSSGSIEGNASLLTRKAIEELNLDAPALVEIKFNWSHAYSSPQLFKTHGGELSDNYWNPKPDNYKIAWMVRNEDFFLLRWGQPDFIREHLRRNSTDYVAGYFVGSECYIPAVNYLDKPDLPNRATYAFQRQWLFYLQWGRLLYDPQTPDAVWENAFDKHYGEGVGTKMVEAYKRASNMPLELATFHNFSWDFTLYSEGFLAPTSAKDGDDGFISVDDLINARPLDPNYMSVPDYAKALDEKRAIEPNRVTPDQLADTLEADGNAALKSVGQLTAPAAGLEQEIADVRAWSHLSLYFSAKLRGAVALQRFRQSGDRAQQTRAIAQLSAAAKSWEAVIAATAPFHDAVPLIHIGDRKFAWANYRAAVQRDIEIAREARKQS